MKLKSMLKFALSALLLSAGLSAFAADGEGETPTAPKVVQLSNGTAVSWADYAKAINDPSSVVTGVDDTKYKEAYEAYQDALAFANGDKDTEGSAAYDVAQAQAKVDAAQEAYDNLYAQLTTLKKQRDGLTVKTEDQVIPWLKTIIASANTSLVGWQAFCNDQSTSAQINYVQYRSSKGFNLYVSFGNYTGTLTVGGTEMGTWQSVSMEDFDKVLFPNGSFDDDGNPLSGKAFLNIFVYLGENLTNYAEVTTENPDANKVSPTITVTKPSSNNDIIQAAYDRLEALSKTAGYHKVDFTQAYKNLTTQIDEIEGEDGNGGTLATAKKTLDDANRELTAAKDAQNNAGTRVTTTKATYDEEKAAWEEAVRQATANASTAYQHVTLTGEVDADVAITVTNFEGIIEGNQNVINIVGNITLFKNFNGTLTDAAINGGTGSFATGTAKGTFQNVTYCAGSTYRYYNDHGAVNTSAITSLGQLAYVSGQANSGFGINYKAEGTKKLVKVGVNNEYKVYNINVYNSATSQWTYANLVSESDSQAPTFNNGGVITPGFNTFVGTKSEDLAGLTNVIFDVTNECANAVITDKEPFYSPINFTATNLNYVRNLSANKNKLNAVCLPFELKKDYFDEETILCYYYGESRANGETNSTFQFKQTASSIPANTPALLWNTTLTTGTQFVDMKNVAIVKTDNQLIKVAAEKAGDSSVSFGTLKSYTTQEIASAAGGKVNEAFRVYGLVEKTGAFQYVSDTYSESENVSIPKAGTFPAFRMVIYSTVVENKEEASAPRRIVILDEKGVEIINEETDGIEEITAAEDASAFNVATGVGEIVFTSEADFGKVDVYSLDGKVVAVADVMAGTTSVNVPKGVYIVMGKKVMVK